MYIKVENYGGDYRVDDGPRQNGNSNPALKAGRHNIDFGGKVGGVNGSSGFEFELDNEGNIISIGNSFGADFCGDTLTLKTTKIVINRGEYGKMGGLIRFCYPKIKADYEVIPNTVYQIGNNSDLGGSAAFIYVTPSGQVKSFGAIDKGVMYADAAVECCGHQVIFNVVNVEIKPNGHNKPYNIGSYGNKVFTGTQTLALIPSLKNRVTVGGVLGDFVTGLVSISRKTIIIGTFKFDIRIV